MLRIGKLKVKKWFFKKNSLPRASCLALGKEIFAEYFFIRREFLLLALGKEISTSLPRVFIWLSAKTRTLGKVFDSSSESCQPQLLQPRVTFVLRVYSDHLRSFNLFGQSKCPMQMSSNRKRRCVTVRWPDGDIKQSRPPSPVPRPRAISSSKGAEANHATHAPPISVLVSHGCFPSI
jgi:hypothetical protein